MVRHYRRILQAHPGFTVKSDSRMQRTSAHNPPQCTRREEEEQYVQYRYNYRASARIVLPSQDIYHEIKSNTAQQNGFSKERVGHGLGGLAAEKREAWHCTAMLSEGGK